MNCTGAQPTPDFAERDRTSITTDVATIILKRKPGLLTVGDERYVIDRGSGVVWDAVMVEKRPFPDDVGNFCDPRNVIYLLSSRTETQPHKLTHRRAPELIIGHYIRQKLSPNTALIGKFDRHGILTWTRPPGRMRIEVIKLNGNQSVCAPIEVAAGMTYTITLHYGDRTEFDVKVQSDLKLAHDSNR